MLNIVRATKQSDQKLVGELANAYSENVTPCFGTFLSSTRFSFLICQGYHPWFTHWIAVEEPSSKEEHYRNIFLQDHVTETNSEILEKMLPELPDPLLLEDALNDIRSNLARFPNAMVGEVGLDRAFRVPLSLASDSTRKLSPFTVPLTHQVRILEAQLDLAVEFKRNVSFHSVKSHQATLQLIDRMLNKYGERWDAISIDMHSCGFSPEVWTSLQVRERFLSLENSN